MFDTQQVPSLRGNEPELEWMGRAWQGEGPNRIEYIDYLEEKTSTRYA